MTGAVIRASKQAAARYARECPGQPVHMDVKKLGRIPDAAVGGPRPQRGSPRPRHRYDYVYPLVDAHSRLACSEVLRYEKGATCAAFLARAAAYVATKGIPRIERVMTDNAFAYCTQPRCSVPAPILESHKSPSARTAHGRTGR